MWYTGLCAGCLFRRTLISEQALVDTCRGVTQRMRAQLGAPERCVPFQLRQHLAQTYVLHWQGFFMPLYGAMRHFLEQT